MLMWSSPPFPVRSHIQIINIINTDRSIPAEDHKQIALIINLSKEIKLSMQ